MTRALLRCVFLPVCSCAKRDALHARGGVLEQAIVGRERYRLALSLGLDHVLDVEMQVAAFEALAAAPRRG